jgi:tetratricopeptide (TPR) repeat protein
MRLTERAAILDRIDERILAGQDARTGEITRGGGVDASSDGENVLAGRSDRDWSALVLAERAADAARINDLPRARALAESVLGSPSAGPLARARAADAFARTLAWTGTDAASSRADRLLADAAERYRVLGAEYRASGADDLAMRCGEWAALATFWRGNAVHFQTGALDRAADLIGQALDGLAPDSPGRASVLSFFAETLIALGRWAQAERALDEGAVLADEHDDARARAYVAWSRARLASVRLDPMATERFIREVERDYGEWFETSTGVTFLADAAEMLDRVGIAGQAGRYLSRAIDRDPDDEFVGQAAAVLDARGGDPVRALEALQELMRRPWLEKRGRWRLTLFAAWATFRAGRDGAGELAAQALEQVRTTGGLDAALATEPELTRAVLPLAADAGSPDAHRALLGDRRFAVRLFSRSRVSGVDGVEIALPPGMPSELVRLLAAEPAGRSVEQVAAIFFPDVPVSTARHRLRQVLARLRAAAEGLVVRDGDRLVLAPAWVDTRAFLAITARVRAARGPRAVQLAYAGLALWTGPPLPEDRYADWAATVRGMLDHRYAGLLDVVIADAEQRGSHQEAVTALSAALEYAEQGYSAQDPRRYDALAGHLLALGRHATALHLARLAGVDLDALDP